MEQNPEDFYEEIQKINYSFFNDGNNHENYKKYYLRLVEITDKIKQNMDEIISNHETKEDKLYNDYKSIFQQSYLTNWCLVLGILILFKFMFDSIINISTIK